MNKMLKVELAGGENVFLTLDEKSNINGLVRLMKEANPQIGEIKVFETGKMPIDELPTEVKQKAMNILRAYDVVNVDYENERWCAMAGIMLKGSYAFDFFVAGRYKAEEVYTREERIQNFKEEFGYAPAYI